MCSVQIQNQLFIVVCKNTASKEWGESYVQTNLFTFVRLNLIQNKYFVGVEKASRTIIFYENQNFS